MTILLSALRSRSGRSFSVHTTEATAFVGRHFLSATVIALPGPRELPPQGGPPHQHRLSPIVPDLLVPDDWPIRVGRPGTRVPPPTLARR